MTSDTCLVIAIYTQNKDSLDISHTLCLSSANKWGKRRLIRIPLTKQNDMVGRRSFSFGSAGFLARSYVLVSGRVILVVSVTGRHTQLILVGGWTNPFEKYVLVQIGYKFPPKFRGWTFPTKIFIWVANHLYSYTITTSSSSCCFTRCGPTYPWTTFPSRRPFLTDSTGRACTWWLSEAWLRATT